MDDEREFLRSEVESRRVVRDLPLERAQASSDGNTLVGYAAVFNTWAEIPTRSGVFRERILPYAFNKTLKENAGDLVALVNHGRDVFGHMPVGVPLVLEPRGKGLWTETRLSNARSVQDEVKPRLEEGSLRGMSITFDVMEDEWNFEAEDGVPERTLKQIRLYEYGPVTFPAYTTTTAGVRDAEAETDLAGAPEVEGRGTEEAAAPEDEGRVTEPDELVLARADVIRHERELEEDMKRWARRQS